MLHVLGVAAPRTLARAGPSRCRAACCIRCDADPGRQRIRRSGVRGVRWDLHRVVAAVAVADRRPAPERCGHRGSLSGNRRRARHREVCGQSDAVMRNISYRDLRTLEEFAQVVELERVIWGPGYTEVVPVPILAVTVMRGGILIGAFDDDRVVGFVYSLPGIKHGKPTQWSHMLGVLDGSRNAGVGRELKLLQRERTLAMGLDLVEWTFDPMQAMNAHLNFARLGVVVEEYEENVYGESSSPLHRGNPTDRFVAEWWVREPHVERRIRPAGAIALRTSELADA